MELQLTKHKPFTDLFEVLKDLIPDTILHCSKEGFKIRASDYSRTFIAFLDIRGGSLSKFNCDGNHEVGVTLSKLWTVMKICQTGDILELRHPNQVGSDDVLIISILDGDTGNVKFTTEYRTYDIEEEVFPIPDHINYSHCFSMKSEKLFHDLRTLQKVECEEVMFRQCRQPNGKGNRLQIVGLGSMIHKNPVFNTDESIVAGDPKKLNELPEIELVFDLKKCVDFARAKCLDPEVAVHLNEEGFMVLQYNVDIYGELRFFIESRQENKEQGDDNPQPKKKKKANKNEDEEAEGGEEELEFGEF